jgi:hypothetical protein
VDPSVVPAAGRGKPLAARFQQEERKQGLFSWAIDALLAAVHEAGFQRNSMPLEKFRSTPLKT